MHEPGGHDPGGKVRLALAMDVMGGAEFCGPDDCYRLLLWRSWGAPDAPCCLWVGMNPSTADAGVDDPTVRREIGYTSRWGLTRYVKANVSAYRTTDPKRLRNAPIRCEENWGAIRRAADNADRIVLAFGTLDGEMRKLAGEIVIVLLECAATLWCLGTTKDGSPRHPLYLRADAPLLEWKGWADE